MIISFYKTEQNKNKKKLRRKEKKMIKNQFSKSKGLKKKDFGALLRRDYEKS